LRDSSKVSAMYVKKSLEKASHFITKSMMEGSQTMQTRPDIGFMCLIRSAQIPGCSDFYVNPIITSMIDISKEWEMKNFAEFVKFGGSQNETTN